MSTKPKVKEPRQCKQCAEEFKAVPTRKGEFCSARCRVLYWRERKSDTALLDALVSNQWSVTDTYLDQTTLGWGVYNSAGLVAKGATYRIALAKAVEYSKQTGSQ